MKTLVLIVVLLISSSWVTAQDSVSLDSQARQELNAVLSNYEVTRLDPISLLSKVDERTYQTTLTISGKKLIISLEENFLLSRNFVAHRNDEPVSLEKELARSFQGNLTGENSGRVRLSVATNFLSASINLNGEMHYIRPLTNFTKLRATENTYVVFKGSDLITDSGVASCGVLEEVNRIEQPQSMALSSSTATSSCDILEIAIEYDYEFFVANGSSLSAAYNSTLATMNQAEAFYVDDFGIEFIIVGGWGWATSSDPYSVSAPFGNGLPVITELKNYWLANRSTVGRDVVYFFTQKSGHGVKGSAEGIGTLCDVSSGTYAFTATAISGINVTTTTTHEIGHLFNAVHPSGTCTSSLMCILPNGVSDTRPLSFNSSNTSAVNSHISGSSGSCLGELASFRISGTDPVCTSRSFWVSAPVDVGFTTLVTNWASSTSNLTVSLGGSGTTATRQNNYNGYATITASGTVGGISGCTFSVSRQIYVGNPPIPTSRRVNGVNYYSGIPVCPGPNTAKVSPGSGPTPSSYTWTASSGVPNWPNGALLDFDFPSSKSNITLTVKANNACGSSNTTSFFITKKTSGCGLFRLVTYPNPSGGNLTIEAVEEDVDATLIPAIEIVPAEIMIFDMSGNLMLEHMPTSHKSTISLEGLPPGEYIVHIKVDSEVVKEHIIIN
ncbi:MAG: zinc-dependent metalloprotease [Cyclobacteriaceae bacterium]